MRELPQRNEIQRTEEAVLVRTDVVDVLIDGLAPVLVYET